MVVPVIKSLSKRDISFFPETRRIFNSNLVGPSFIFSTLGLLVTGDGFSLSSRKDAGD